MKQANEVWLNIKEQEANKMNNERNIDNRIKLIDQDIADIVLVLKFVIEGTGGNHDENIRARRNEAIKIWFCKTQGINWITTVNRERDIRDC